MTILTSNDMKRSFFHELPRFDREGKSLLPVVGDMFSIENLMAHLAFHGRVEELSSLIDMFPGHMFIANTRVYLNRHCPLYFLTLALLDAIPEDVTDPAFSTIRKNATVTLDFWKSYYGKEAFQPINYEMYRDELWCLREPYKFESFTGNTKNTYLRCGWTCGQIDLLEAILRMDLEKIRALLGEGIKPKRGGIVVNPDTDKLDFLWDGDFFLNIVRSKFVL